MRFPVLGGAAVLAMLATCAAWALDQPPAVEEPTAAAESSTEEFRAPAGFKTRKRGETTVYCNSETPTGSRFPVERCYTRTQLAEVERRRRAVQEDVARSQRACSTGTACGGG